MLSELENLFTIVKQINRKNKWSNLVLYKINESGEMSVPLDVTDLMSDDLSQSIPSAHLFEFQKDNSGVIKNFSP